jgi:hypothetical protein
VHCTVPSNIGQCTLSELVTHIRFTIDDVIKVHTSRLVHITLPREVSTSSIWDGGSVEPLDHSHHGAIVNWMLFNVRFN